ncbi:TlpA family protein disulfide reductase [Elongatibacter sediminis]|uniref:TlpA disulfide reductase family protein n=1 Tax=Elongatibacter sediminis TaxID=3119006 RepID=A0AAW9RM03_9GAMM
MMPLSPAQLWARLRAHFWLSLAFDVTVLLLVFVAIHAWQTRDLPIGELAPAGVMPALDGSGLRQPVHLGGPGVVYFFAPWCGVCRSSIGNLDELVADGTLDWATAVALDYADPAAVEAFVKDTDLAAPVLLGGADTIAGWGIGAFPTYFVIDASGNIASRSVGYSTRLGMEVRARLAR